MKVIWAPWRMEYILSEKEGECIFCRLLDQKPSSGNHLLLKTERAMVLMNKYPYNNGHIMVAPHRHTADFDELAADEFMELMEVFRFSLKALQKCMSPEGFNAGLNLGHSGGAGVEDHLHWHIVPRWQGDTNYMPVITGTRVIPEAIEETYNKLLPIFREFGSQKG
ncbi:MAG: HIT domain-containing protein [bacterium]